MRRWPNPTLVTKEAKLNNNLVPIKVSVFLPLSYGSLAPGLKHWMSGSLTKTAVHFETQEREGGWGHIVHQVKRIALLQFPKMSFALFIGTSKPL